MTLLSNHFYPAFFFFGANYCVIVTTNFSRCCPAKAFIFYSAHPEVCTAIIIIIIIIIAIMIDKTVSQDCHRGKRNLSMAWMDVKKAYGYPLITGG